MGGTTEGGKKTATTNRTKYGASYYARIGSLGGKISRGGGFASSRELAVRAGRISGTISKKGYTFLGEEGDVMVYEHKRTKEIVKFKNGIKLDATS